MYQHARESHWPLIVVPEVVGRTVEVPRGVVTIAYTDTQPKVDVTVDEIGSDGSDTAKRLDLDRFMRAIPKDLVQPYKDGIEAWEAAGGTITFTNEVMFFEMCRSRPGIEPVWRPGEERGCGMNGVIRIGLAVACC